MVLGHHLHYRRRHLLRLATQVAKQGRALASFLPWLTGTRHQDVYMMEVLAGAFASKFTPITAVIWTDCMAILKATVDSWKTSTRYADPTLTFETIGRTKPNLKWTRGHPENHEEKRAEWL